MLYQDISIPKWRILLIKQNEFLHDYNGMGEKKQMADISLLINDIDPKRILLQKRKRN
jgi:hypothetical protein|nr:MAG TPA: hypothetical protein [Bacteriophage sp.]